MTTSTTAAVRPERDRARPAPDRSRRRERAVTVVAAILAALFLLAFGGLPTLLSAPFSTQDGGVHALHELAEGLHLTLFGVLLTLFAVRRTWRPAAFQLYLAAGLPATLVAAVLLEPVAVVASLLVTAIPALLLYRLTPTNDRRGLLAGGGWSTPLTVLALLAAVPLCRYAWLHLAMQRSFPAEEAHAALHHWSGMAVFALTVLTLTVVTARRPAGWVPGAIVTGGFVGLLAAGSLVLSPIASGLGTAGGVAALLGGASLVVVAVRGRTVPDPAAR